MSYYDEPPNDFYGNDPRCPKCKGDPCDDCCRGCGAGPEQACDEECPQYKPAPTAPQRERIDGNLRGGSNAEPDEEGLCPF